MLPVYFMVSLIEKENETKQNIQKRFYMRFKVLSFRLDKAWASPIQVSFNLEASSKFPDVNAH